MDGVTHCPAQAVAVCIIGHRGPLFALVVQYDVRLILLYLADPIHP